MMKKIKNVFEMNIKALEVIAFLINHRLLDNLIV